jgi:Fe-S cluster assembly iron-binding protein IscA
MLNVTDRAVDLLARTLDETEAGDEQGFRIIRTSPGELGLTIDEVKEGDQVIRQEARPVLLVESWISDALDGATLDLSEDQNGASLMLHAPEDNHF